MPRIFELFGYRLNDNTELAEDSRRNAYCPFMGRSCDGGGNRPQSTIHLADHTQLADYFKESGLESVPSGICSIQLHTDQPPWIICPRRLLFLGKSDGKIPTTSISPSSELKALLTLVGFGSGERIGVWPELKLKYTSSTDGTSFDYTFDYVLFKLDRVSLSEIADETNDKPEKVKSRLGRLGYEPVSHNDAVYFEDCATGPPLIIEVMTSSTSGGNKNKRTTIPMAFEDALLKLEHEAPGINYRQVWARMASQLIVKSEVALAWGGIAVWVVQNQLVDYISRTTALQFEKFKGNTLDDVNVLALAYSSQDTPIGETAPFLDRPTLYSGPIRQQNEEPSFLDIIRIGLTPPKSALMSLVYSRPPATIIDL